MIFGVDDKSAAADGRDGADRQHHGRRAWRWFAVWAVTGAAGSFGVIGLLSIGLPFLVLAAVVTVWLLTRHPESRAGVWGLASGASVVAAFLAWINRGGPGEVCRTDGNVMTCQQAWNPVPFAAVAALLLGGGLIAFVLMARRTGSRATLGD